MVPLLTEDEVAHWLIPRHDVVYAWVVEDASTKAITDFISFYSLPSTIIGNAKYNTLRVRPAPPAFMSFCPSKC